MIYVTALKGDNLARGTRYDLCYQRFPKKWQTLGVRWPKRHGVTAP